MTTERRFTPGFRVRVFGILAVLLAGGATTGIVIQRIVLHAQLDREIEANHDQELRELTQLATGRDPRTGEPFGDDVAAVFDTYLRRNVPGLGETYLGFVGGQLHGSSRPLEQLDLDRDQLRAWRDLRSGARGTTDSATGPVRWLASPITRGDEVAGVFVVATSVERLRQDIDDALRTEAIVGAIVLLVTLAIGYWVTGRLLQPVRAVTDNARRISASDLSERIPVSGHDDIAELARSYNEMLDRLETVLVTQRRFLDAAGHELRTPITIVRGHLEVMGDDPQDRQETLELVSDELDRMARMVDDLLVLARAEQPNFVDRRPTDLAALTDGLLDKAWAVGARAWVVDGAAEGWGSVDRQRLEQAALNLVRNAVEHTAEGDEVAIGTAHEDGALRIWVRDTGPGVPPADRERIFERFARGASGRGRSEGAGLGLSIVRTIAEAHGGHVTLDDAPGGGSVFTIVVPTGPVDHDPPEPFDRPSAARTQEEPWPAS